VSTSRTQAPVDASFDLGDSVTPTVVAAMCVGRLVVSTVRVAGNARRVTTEATTDYPFDATFQIARDEDEGIEATYGEAWTDGGAGSFFLDLDGGAGILLRVVPTPTTGIGSGFDLVFYDGSEASGRVTTLSLIVSRPHEQVGGG
jgi:hypothetical protein